MDDVTDIREYYNNSWDAEVDRLDRHRLEAEITWRYLDRELPAEGRILEIGCATGSYTFALAERGYAVTAVDLADAFIEGCRARAEERGIADRVDFRVGDARTLEGIPRNAFDAVLLMGPLYHLVLESDRTAALRNAFDCLKPGGVIISALISRFGVLGHLVRKIPEWIENSAEVRSHLRHGHQPPGAPKGGFRGYYVRVDEIAPMHEAAGFRTGTVAGVEPAISADDESYNRLEGAQRELWCDLLFEMSVEPSMIAASRHLLYIGHKPGA